MDERKLRVYRWMIKNHIQTIDEIPDIYQEELRKEVIPNGPT